MIVPYVGRHIGVGCLTWHYMVKVQLKQVSPIPETMVSAVWLLVPVPTLGAILLCFTSYDTIWRRCSLNRSVPFLKRWRILHPALRLLLVHVPRWAPLLWIPLYDIMPVLINWTDMNASSNHHITFESCGRCFMAHDGHSIVVICLLLHYGSPNPLKW